MATKYQGPSQRQVLKDSVDSVKKMMADPITSRAVQKKDKIMKSFKADQKKLEAITPPAVTDDAERSRLEQRNQSLVTAMREGNASKNIESMPSKEHHWDPPSHAIGKEVRWQEFWLSHTVNDKGEAVRAKDNYSAIDEWKDNQRRLHKEKEETHTDLCSIESFRPDRIQGELRGDYAKTQFSLSNLDQEKYDQAFPDHELTDVEKKLKAVDDLMAQAKALQEQILGTQQALNPTTEPEVQGPPVEAAPVRVKCAFITNSGTQCKRLALPDSKYCNHPKHRVAG